MNPSFLTRLGSLCLMIAALHLAAPSAGAQNYDQQLQRLEERQRALAREQDALRSKSQALSVEMANVKPVQGPEKAAYDEAVAGFEEASENYENDPSPTNKSRLRNAEFKLHLAERKFRQANEQLSELEQEHDEVESELSRVRRELDQVKREIPETRERLARQREQQQRAARERERERQQASAGQNQPPQTEPAPSQPAKSKSAAAEAEMEKRRDQLARRSDKEADNARQSKAATSNEPIQLDQHFQLLTNKAQVLTALANLELRIGGDGLKIRSNKILNIRHFVDGKEVEKNSHRFKGLGNYQYKATAKVKPGENRVRVSFSRWNIDMPEEFANEELVILMDASNRNSPKILCYPARFENEA